MGVIGSTMARFNSSNCDAIIINNDTISRAIMRTRFQRTLEIIYRSVVFKDCIQMYVQFRRCHIIILPFPEPMYWLRSVKTIIWWRNLVVAPLAEEWAFRACMLPLLLQCFTPITAIFICPLFFGAAHFHHIVDRVKAGMNFKNALFISCKYCSHLTRAHYSMVCNIFSFIQVSNSRLQRCSAHMLLFCLLKRVQYNFLIFASN